MSDGTKIEWTDATWSPITGCSVVSAGCKNCYAMKLAGTRLQHHPSRAGLTIDTSNGPVWNGEVRFNEQWLDQPLKWRRPRMIFVCAHGDLFHESVPDEWIDRVFAVMALAPHHTFQVLTKRASRMQEYLLAEDVVRRICTEAEKIHNEFYSPDPKWHEFTAPDTRRFNDKMNAWRANVGRLCAWLSKGGAAAEMFARNEPGRSYPSWVEWPRKNIWLGVSVENQEAADERIPLLLQTPAAVRWISAEPLLGPVDLSLYFAGHCPEHDFSGGFCTQRNHEGVQHLHWVVAGGESGHNARPMHPDWIQILRDQCNEAGVPFLFKQWGEWEIASVENGHYDCNMEQNSAYWVHFDGATSKPSYLREGYENQEMARAMIKVGKKKSGRTLDGRTWDEYPKAAS